MQPLCGEADFVQLFIYKSKPVEKQGRKVSDLSGKTYDSGAAGIVTGCSSSLTQEGERCVTRKTNSRSFFRR
jgi:hypothetical protein